MLYTGMTLKQPAAVRYPRGRGPGAKVEKEMHALQVGKAEIRRRGKKLAILGFGALVENARAAADALDATLVNMRFVKPLDAELLQELATSHQAFVTIEDNAIAGGAGSAVAEFLAANDIGLPLLNLGLPDVFLEHGSREECLAMAGLDPAGIQKSVTGWLAKQMPAQRKAGNK
jgi:1-deoxy-D-xylulose-5-phosphate synthase